ELTCLIDQSRIHRRTAEIAAELSDKFADKTPIFIGILNGSFIFLSDLIREMTVPSEVDFIKVSSYAGNQSTGTIRLIKDISADITDRHVIVVEDIIDTGLTIKFINDRMLEAGPASVTIVTLLLKPDMTQISFPVDYVGFEIPPEFVVGYGLDYDQQFRYLPAIYRIEGNGNE
ncbi:MAG: hypoxanthine phosphoribosyltransferase, partial [Fidelibacterota bacterium]